MDSLEDILERDDWLLRVEVDPNEGGDGPRVRFEGDSRAFRNFAAIMMQMADAVDRKDHPAAASGWFLMFGGEMPQFEIQGAKFLSLACEPIAR